MRSNISCDGTEHIVSAGHIELASAPFLTATPYGRMHGYHQPIVLHFA
ncbi:MAG: hypothetical protein IJZ04_04255 [Clostridia bacterium]|nr:hypothetical protein [Clostridia bacterium]